MRRLVFVITLIIVCMNFSGYAYAGVVAHFLNPDIVGLFESGVVCFNNDGAITSSAECDQSPVDEGLIEITNGNWSGGASSGIILCLNEEIAPLSGATCTLTFSEEFTCNPDGWVLVKTTMSGHFWSIKADATCTDIGFIWYCDLGDAFNPSVGCADGAVPSTNDIQIDGGYIQLDTRDDEPLQDCIWSEHYGRMVLVTKDDFDILWICGKSGWKDYHPGPH